MAHNKSALLLICFILFTLDACNNSLAIESYTPLPPISTVTTTSLSLLPVRTVRPTPTQWLPYNPKISDEGCDDLFTPTIPINETEKLPPEKIAQKLVEVYLEHFLSQNLGRLCRLEDFKVTEIKPGQIVVTMPEDQKPEYSGTVDIAVKVKEIPTIWYTVSGNLAPDGWIVHKLLNILITIINDQYILTFTSLG